MSIVAGESYAKTKKQNLMMSTRLETNYENHSKRFLLNTFDYNKQYSHFYAHRLAEMTGLMLPLIQQRWGEEHPVKKLCDLQPEQQETAVIIGTIYKHQAHKPSILREISEENQLAPQPPRAHYADPEDKLILEDALQRVRLFGKFNVRCMASGVVCAVLGSIEEDGRFDVEDVLYYEGGPQRPLPQLNSKRLLVLISGIDQLQCHNYTDSLNLFQNWMSGNLKGNQNNLLVRLIVAGNSVSSTPEERALSATHARNVEPNATVGAMRALDTWFAAWSQSIPIDVMPGAHDPANFMLPQQPFHKFMLPQAARHASFQSVTNPYACSVDGALILGCSGQNVHDLLRCTMIEEPLEALRNTLTWSHLAPTAPDTLACYPYLDSDPFIIRECPHVYFVGNCEKFASELHSGTAGQRTRLVCVPNFAKTQSIVVVDLETLDSQHICFNIQND